MGAHTTRGVKSSAQGHTANQQHGPNSNLRLWCRRRGTRQRGPWGRPQLRHRLPRDLERQHPQTQAGSAGEPGNCGEPLKPLPAPAPAPAPSCQGHHSSRGRGFLPNISGGGLGRGLPRAGAPRPPKGAPHAPASPAPTPRPRRPRSSLPGLDARPGPAPARRSRGHPGPAVTLAGPASGATVRAQGCPHRPRRPRPRRPHRSRPARRPPPHTGPPGAHLGDPRGTSHRDPPRAATTAAAAVRNRAIRPGAPPPSDHAPPRSPSRPLPAPLANRLADLAVTRGGATRKPPNALLQEGPTLSSRPPASESVGALRLRLPASRSGGGWAPCCGRPRLPETRRLRLRLLSRSLQSRAGMMGRLTRSTNAYCVPASSMGNPRIRGSDGL